MEVTYIAGSHVALYMHYFFLLLYNFLVGCLNLEQLLKFSFSPCTLFLLFLFPDPSLTPENLSTVVDIMSDNLWFKFGRHANIPRSEMDRISRQCTSHRECKQALIHTFLSSHPAPSWTLVAWALYMTEWYEQDGSCLKASDHLRQLFLTGILYS